MITVIARFDLEMEPIDDAIGTLVRIRRALIGHHGKEFRELDRRIEALTGDPGIPGMMALDDVTVVTPPDAWIALIREARDLGVIT